ncbi:hypothetical protein XBFFL1_940015 [Xenorhabdus bovienii str. feltiae Florida]|nr:hypothetical protein XBFFR1_2470015 [Xenorhabdus bovienii str. feltiae France]CDG94959.1 hypothetical protein XBFFL1_940015 [Xenorhabdus bovienii str. feltiae Florida]
MARDYAYIVLMCLVPEGKKIVFFYCLLNLRSAMVFLFSNLLVLA